MAKSDRKLHEARMAGAAWLMNVIKTQGMEAAEKELKTRGAVFIPLEVSKKQLNEAVYKIKLNTIDCILIMSCMVLRDEFDFGQNLKTDALCDEEIIWDDLIQTLKEETGLDFTIRENK